MTIFGLREVGDRNSSVDPSNVSGNISVLLDVQYNDETVTNIDLTLGDEVISCRGASSDAASPVGLADSGGSVEVECFFDTDQVAGECMGMQMEPRFANGEHELGARITTSDGTFRDALASQMITLKNTNYVMLEHSPGSQSTVVKGLTFHGGPAGDDESNVNSFHACPVAFNGTTVGELSLHAKVTGPGAAALDQAPPALAFFKKGTTSQYGVPLADKEAPFTWTVSAALNRAVENTAGENEHWLINSGDIKDDGGLLVTDEFRTGDMAKLGPRYFDFKAPTFSTGDESGISIKTSAGTAAAKDEFYSSGSFVVNGLDDDGVGGAMTTIAVGDASVAANADTKKSTAFVPAEGLADVSGIGDLPEDDKTDDFNDVAGVDSYVAEVTMVYDGFMNVASLPTSPIRTASTFGVDKTAPEASDEQPSRDGLVLKADAMLEMDVEDPKLSTGEAGSGLSANAVWYTGSSYGKSTAGGARGMASTSTGSVEVSTGKVGGGKDGTYSVKVLVSDRAVPPNRTLRTFNYTRDSEPPTFTISRSQSDIGLTRAAAVTVAVGGTVSDKNVIVTAELSVRRNSCAAADSVPASRIEGRNKRDLEDGTDSITFGESFTIKRPKSLRAAGAEKFCFWLDVEDIAVGTNNRGPGNEMGYKLGEFTVEWDEVTLVKEIVAGDEKGQASATEGVTGTNDANGDGTADDPVNHFPVKLLTEPTGDVTVTVGDPSPPVGSIDTDLVADGNQNTLTFTAANYDSAQNVYVTITHDLNAASESVTLDLSAKGGGYAAAKGSVTIKTADDDVGLSVNVMSIREDADSTAVVVTATAATAPTADAGLTIPLTLAGTSGAGDTDFRATMTGTANEIVIPKGKKSAIDTVYVTALDDANTVSELGEQIEISDNTRTEVNGLYVTPRRITIIDADPDITLSLSRTSLNEGSDATAVTVTATLGAPSRGILTFTIGDVSTCSAVSASSAQTFRIDTGQTSGSGSVTVTPVADINDNNVDCEVTATVEPATKPGGSINWTIKAAELTIVNADDSES
ncbi:hypothetical protein [Candidatus Palauibacter sp.]|uniref:hypothetical protein n=1 Tax=Candidatus Palauibacter sp. TaxID=3101350 RepID=UPI003D0B8C55